MPANKSENKLGTRDIMTVAAMMVIFFIASLVVGAVALAIPPSTYTVPPP